MPASTFDWLLDSVLPTNVYEGKRPTGSFNGVLHRKIVFALFAKNKEFALFEFTVGSDWQVHAFLNPRKWQFAESTNKNPGVHLLKRELPLHFGSLFVPFQQFLTYLEALVFEGLKQTEVSWFITSNSDSVVVTTEAGKQIDLKDSIFDKLSP